MEWLLVILIIGLIYIGIDYGRLVVKSRKHQEIQFTSDLPSRHIMIKASASQHIHNLIKMDMEAHKKADISIKVYEDKLDQGIMKIIYDNNDELIIYDYDKAQIVPLKQNEIKDYAHKLFFDYTLPQGAERAIIEQLGLLDYMVNIGICSEKGGE